MVTTTLYFVPRSDRQPVNGNMQAGSGKSELVHIANLLARPAQGLIDFRGIEALSRNNDWKH
jgi:ABC-type methionine transport system ATPase subunit